jgi:hypothetical protein
MTFYRNMRKYCPPSQSSSVPNITTSIIYPPDIMTQLANADSVTCPYEFLIPNTTHEYYGYQHYYR